MNIRIRIIFYKLCHISEKEEIIYEQPKRSIRMTDTIQQIQNNITSHRKMVFYIKFLIFFSIVEIAKVRQIQTMHKIYPV